MSVTPWSGLSTSELDLLATTFWSAGGSRHGMAERLGYSRSKANALIAGLLDQGLLVEAGQRESTGGRKPEQLCLSADIGVLAAIYIGATSLNVALLLPDLTVLARHEEVVDVREGPGVVLARVRQVLRELLATHDIASRRVISMGIGVPGPVNFEIGQLINPPLMPGWDRFSIRDYLREDYAAPVFVDNDVNLMAMAELWRLQRSLQNFLVIKVGTGIGCGIVCHGEVYRGAAGAAGDVGHISVDPQGPRCHCGNVGCVEAMAAGPAIVRQAQDAAERGDSAVLRDVWQSKGRIDAMDVGHASRGGDVVANAIIQRAGNLVGHMLAAVVNFFNPSHVFIGGGITQIGPLFLAAVRQSVYQRSLALSTRQLDIQYTPWGMEAGVVGAGVLAMHEALRSRGIAP